MAINEVLRNSRHYSHASTRTRMFGIPIRGVKEWSVKASVERGEVRGDAREVLGFTIGDVKYECSVKILRASWDVVVTAIRAQGMSPLDATGIVSFTIAEPGLPSRSYEVLVNGINDFEQSSSQGVEALEVPLTFATLMIKEDGKPLLDAASAIRP